MRYAGRHMDTEQTLARLEQKVDAIYVSVEKTRKYIQWALIATVVGFALPLLAAMFIVPAFLSSYTSSIQTLIQ